MTALQRFGDRFIGGPLHSLHGWTDSHVNAPLGHAWGWLGGKAAGGAKGLGGGLLDWYRSSGRLADDGQWLHLGGSGVLKAGGGVKGLLGAAGGLGWKVLAGAGAFLVGALGALRLVSSPRRRVTRRIRTTVAGKARHARQEVVEHVESGGGLLRRLVLIALVLMLLGVVSPGQLVTAGAPGYGQSDGIPNGGVQPSSLTCGGPVDVSVTAGVQGGAARLGSWLHGLATWDGDPQDTYDALHGAAVHLGQWLGTFRTYLDGKHLTVTLPGTPSSSSGAVAASASCCGSTPTGGAPQGTPASWTPHTGDTPAQAAARALLAATAADQAAGLATPDPVVFLAIAGGESDYNPAIKNPSSTATGLWQLIDSNWHGIDPRDPYANARQAAALWRQQGLGAWVAYTSGTYLLHVEEARGALQSVSGFVGPTATAVQVDAPAPVAPAALCVPATAGQPAPANVEAAVQRALSQLGVPYSWGGGNADGPTLGIAQGAGTVGFDCSGLVSYAYGLRPREVTTGLLLMGTRVTPGQEQRGDLVFPDAGHVGIALGDGTYVEAPHTGDVVKVAPYGTPWAVVRLALGGSRQA